ncbi:MAG: phosphotransferase [Paludibacteraceae bacterium]|nr:phosphotransferase [Paludibacteraceae bacterium]MBN2787930.1 phosphotransferase [Paludibacteraceae bacterium]
MEELCLLFEQYTGKTPTEVTKLKVAGSNRLYYRLSNTNIRVVGVIGESLEENKAFVELAKHFAENHLPTPRIYAYTSDYRYYIQEDLGDVSLFDFCENGIKTGVFSKNEKAMLLKTIEFLPRLQVEGARELDFSYCYPQPEFDRNTVLWDLNYFKYCFLKTIGIDFLEPQLEVDFQQLASDLLEEKSDTFLYRDFQARNVMIKDNQPYFIDFQGGRKGPVYYDVASFVWQAKANYPPQLREDLLAHYLTALQHYQPIDEANFRKKLQLFVLFRTLQVLGAYGFRGYFEQKPHFVESIPFAIDNLRELLKNDFSKYPYLIELLHALCELPRFGNFNSTDGGTLSQPVSEILDNSKLTVTVTSFSYKKGIPDDESGNGGGYVFDCRGMHNPGRYEEYKQLTGLDKPVIDFLEKEGEIQGFLQSAYKLADAHIQDFLKRGFSHVMFSFGCTGGQHRSVYCAQHLAAYVADKYGVKVKLNHREQNIKKELH